MKCWNEFYIERDGVKQFVPCGKCYSCRLNKRMEWTFRISKELFVSISAYFVTLTYSDENLHYRVDKTTGEMLPVLRKADLQSFIKRLRYYSSFRYFAVGEYGEQTMRPHYHILMFNLSRKAALKIEFVWNVGNVHIGRVETGSIHYMTKDMMKPKTKTEVMGIPGFRIMSTKPGIGAHELIMDSMLNNKLDNDFKVFLNGYKLNMPRYYRDKIFSIKQKEEHIEEMIRQSDDEFYEYLEKCRRKGIDNPFVYMNENRQDLLRQEEKQLKLRKL